jgi:glyoxylase-like metal-dependent hydrolase (beta-lactamase superfamily II)
MSRAVVTPFDVGRLRLDLTDVYGLPEGHPDGGPCAIPLLCYHVRSGTRSVLVDAPRCEFTGVRAVYAVEGYVPPPPLTAQMAARGIDAGAVGDVVVTHAHFDHFNEATEGALEPAFPNARHHLGAPDLTPDVLDELGNATFGFLRAVGLLDPTEGVLELGEGLSILPAPGETPGHQVLHVHTAGVEAFIAGDLYHQPLELHDPARHARWADAAESARSKRALAEHALRTGATVYFAHIATPHRVERHRGRLRWIPVGR